MATTLADIHPDIVQTHILPRLDGPSLSATATASSHLKTLCSNDALWSQIAKITWPSITHPFVEHLISTFPAGYRSFFHDSFPTLTTDVNPRRSWSTSKPDSCSTSSCHLYRPSDTGNLYEFISAVDIRYQNEVIYSKANVATISPDDLSSAFCIELNDNKVSKSIIDLTVDEIAGADEATLTHLKESLTLYWILIDPTRKRACNLSSIKPYTARQDWVSNDTILRYITVLPGCGPNELVKCRIQVVLGAGEKGVGLYVKEVTLKLVDLDGVRLKGVEYVAVVAGAMAEGKRVVVDDDDDEERWKSYMVFKEVKKEKKEWEEKRERRREVVVWLNHVAIFVSFFFCVYFFYLLLV